MSEHSGYPGAPPGWYPDPAGGPGQRWWDGYAWTEATVLPQHPPPPPWAGAGPPQGPASEVAPWVTASQRLSAFNAGNLVADELGMVTIARVAVVMPAVYYLVNLIAAARRTPTSCVPSATSSGWTGTTRRTASRRRPITVRADSAPSASSSAWSRSLPWSWPACGSDRAASAGRALGIPSRRSPAWGVGAWFVPVVNLWVPYSAIRDCLPPGDRHRSRVLQWWIAWLLAAFLSSAAALCALFSTGAALVLSIPAALACLAVIAWAPGIVMAIAAAHREAVASTAQETGAHPGLRQRSRRCRTGPVHPKPSLSKQFTLRLLSCCRTFIWCGYGPRNGRRRGWRGT